MGERMAPSKSSNHVYLLVKFGTNLKAQFKIVSCSDVVSYNYSSLDEEIFVQFPETIRLCSVVATSNDQFDLEYQILRLEAECDSISDDCGEDVLPVTITLEDDDDVVDEEDVRPEVNLPVTLTIEEVFVDEQGRVKEEWGINVEPVEDEKPVYEKDVTLKVNHLVTTSILKDPVDEEISDYEEDVNFPITGTAAYDHPVDEEMSEDEDKSKVHLPVATSFVEAPVDEKKPVKVRKRPQRAAAKCKKYTIESSSTGDDEEDGKDCNDNKNDGMIKFGPYRTSIPAKDFCTINWSSYPSATRQLLRILFTKEILRSHCLTGRHCNANAHLKSKRTPQLDFKKIEDIISIVAEKCKVEKLVAIRRVIRNKCAEELKSYKYRNGISVRKRYNKR